MSVKYMVYDDGGKTADRYTIFPRSPEWDADATKTSMRSYLRTCLCLSGCPAPWEPQGFSQFSTGIPGPHLGKRIQMDDLPDDIRQHALSRLK